MGRDLSLRLVAGTSPLLCATQAVGVKVVWSTFAAFEWSAHTKGVVPAAIPGRVFIRDWSEPGLVPRTVHIKRFEEQVTGTYSWFSPDVIHVSIYGHPPCWSPSSVKFM